MFVFSGLLPICQDEDSLAVILGHEIAHNVAHHGAERLSHAAFLLPFVLAASIVFNVTGGSFDVLSELIFSLPNSRLHEAEADHIGLLMMAQSCYDPEAAIQFWQRMHKVQRIVPPQFLSTHPSDDSRIKALTDWLPEAQDKYYTSGCGLTGGYAQKFTEAFRKESVGGRKQPVISQPSTQPQQDDEEYW